MLYVGGYWNGSGLMGVGRYSSIGNMGFEGCVSDSGGVASRYCYQNGKGLC